MFCSAQIYTHSGFGISLNIDGSTLIVLQQLIEFRHELSAFAVKEAHTAYNIVKGSCVYDVMS